MARIERDPLAASLVGEVSGQTPVAPATHHNVFGAILRAATRVAAAAIPVVGPAIGAAVDAIASRHESRIGPFRGESETLRYLELQRQIEQETRVFETASNVLKARHDATMNAIRNLRS